MNMYILRHAFYTCTCFLKLHGDPIRNTFATPEVFDLEAAPLCHILPPRHARAATFHALQSGHGGRFRVSPPGKIWRDAPPSSAAPFGAGQWRQYLPLPARFAGPFRDACGTPPGTGGSEEGAAGLSSTSSMKPGTTRKVSHEPIIRHHYHHYHHHDPTIAIIIDFPHLYGSLYGGSCSLSTIGS